MRDPISDQGRGERGQGGLLVSTHLVDVYVPRYKENRLVVVHVAGLEAVRARCESVQSGEPTGPRRRVDLDAGLGRLGCSRERELDMTWTLRRVRA